MYEVLVVPSILLGRKAGGREVELAVTNCGTTPSTAYFNRASNSQKQSLMVGGCEGEMVRKLADIPLCR